MTCDPETLSMSELERITRRYAAELVEVVGPDKDVPAPDVGTTPQIMAWFMDTYSMHARTNVAGVVTGKPVELGGSRGRVEATGRGIALVTLDELGRRNLDPKQARIAVQGFGNVGSVTASLLAERGCRVIAISDVHGAIVNPDGVDVAAAREYQRAHHGLDGFRGGDRISNAALLELDCDVLIPAALEDVITAANAPRVRAKLVVEGANGPTTPDADEILRRNGIVVVPDILANAGGVIVSYFEWVQDRQGYFWRESEVNERLAEVLLSNFAIVRERAAQSGASYRAAAYAVAIGRVTSALHLRGIYA